MKNQRKNPLPLSQREIAAYLGVSHSLMSMVGTGRYGTRDLNSSASEKLTELVETFRQSKEDGQSGSSIKRFRAQMSKESIRLGDQMIAEAKYAGARAAVLKNSLAEMVKKAQEVEYWLNTIDLLLAKIKGEPKATEQRLWLQYQQGIARKKLQKNGWTAQAKLKVRIEMEMAKVRVYRDMGKKLKNFI